MKLTHITHDDDSSVFLDELVTPLDWPGQFEKGSFERRQAKWALEAAAERHVQEILHSDPSCHAEDEWEIRFSNADLKITSTVTVEKEISYSLDAWCVSVDGPDEADEAE